MTIQISELGLTAAEQASLKARTEATMLKPEEPYYAAGATDLVLPESEKQPQPRIVATVSYSPMPTTMAPSGSAAWMQAAPAPPLVRAARREAKKSGIPWKTVGIVAGAIAVTGLVTYMLVRPTRGVSRAMAGLPRRRRRR